MYLTTLKELYSLTTRGMRLELDRMRRACELFGNPERNLKFVHVAGTNGKGSVCACLDAACRDAGYRTGLFTSPHLHSFCERIQIDGHPIAQSKVVTLVEHIRRTLAEADDPPELTFFEMTFLLALLAFQEARVDLVILEVGLGGRFDATNVVTPEVSVITKISLDHTQYLGDTIDAIAREKAGIIKPGVPVVLGRQSSPIAMATLVHQAQGHVVFDANDVPVERCETSIRARAPTLVLEVPHASQPPNSVTLTAVTEAALTTSAATLAALATRGFHFPAAVRAAYLWPGRLERIAYAGKTFVLDAAHNLDGMQCLKDSVTGSAESRSVIFGVMRDKAWLPMAQLAASIATPNATILWTQVALQRALPATELADAVAHQPNITTDNTEQALTFALQSNATTVVVCGSIFVMAEIRARLLGIAHEPPIPF